MIHNTKELAIASGDAGLNVLEMAKALGLKTNRMVDFKLESTAGKIITVTASYYCENGEIESLVSYVKGATQAGPTAA